MLSRTTIGLLFYKEKQGYYAQQDYYRYLSLQGALGLLYSAGLLQVQYNILVYMEKQGYCTQQGYYRYLSLQGAAGTIYSVGILQVS
jgi:hypothetical protein